jgi:hypothetical protein
LKKITLKEVKNMRHSNENMNKLYILSDRENKKKHHVSYDTILGMENEFLENESTQLVQLSRGIYYTNKLLAKLIHKRIVDFTIGRFEGQNFFYAAMSLGYLRQNAETLRYLVVSGNNVSIYCFDTWETQYVEWEKMFDYIRPTTHFFAYKQSVAYFSQKYENVFFLPQSMDRTFFHDYSEKKSRLFMQMGRKSETIHKMILQYMDKKGLADIEENYVYEKEKGKIIYPDTKELARNINKTKYFVSAPQSLENAELTGSVSDVTARFYEAMASKTLIIGYKPQDVFDELFPYEGAMVNLEENKLDDVVEFFERNPEEYQKQINQNYDYVMKEHTWSNRLKTIRAHIGTCHQCG